MVIPAFPSFRSSARHCILWFLTATVGFAGIPGRGGYWGFRGGYGGFRGGYYGGFRGPAYYRGGWRVGWGWGPGFFYPVLPLGCLVYYYGGAPWYYGGGWWYRPYDLGYVTDYPPVGIVVPSIPPDCSTVSVGGVSYYSANGIYYTAASPGPGYVVAAPPPGRAAAAPPAGSADAAALDALVVFPKNGQSVDKMVADRRDAQQFATNRTGYDPAHSDPNDPGTPRARQAFLNSMKSYLEDHGYAVH